MASQQGFTHLQVNESIGHYTTLFLVCYIGLIKDTFSFELKGRCPVFAIESIARSVIWISDCASESRRTAPLSNRERSSNSECKDKVAT